MNKDTCVAACRIYGHAVIPDGMQWQCIRCLMHIPSILRISCAYFVLGQWYCIQHATMEWNPTRLSEAPPLTTEQMLAAVIKHQKANFRRRNAMREKKLARYDAASEDRKLTHQVNWCAEHNHKTSSEVIEDKELVTDTLRDAAAVDARDALGAKSQ